MFSLDTKQWESVAAGLLSSVAKPEAEQTEQKPADKETNAEPAVEAVAKLSDER
jgi:hypothetical protein